MKATLVVGYECLFRIIFSLPRFALFNALKAKLLRSMGARVGRRCVFYPGVWLMPGRMLELGDDVDLALGVIITTSGGVKIGSRTLVGYRTQILSRNHRIGPSAERIFDSGHESLPVDIGCDAWIGANCVILPGVSIGEGAVIGAGAVVTKDVPSYAIAVGNPARVVRYREGV